MPDLQLVPIQIMEDAAVGGGHALIDVLAPVPITAGQSVDVRLFRADGDTLYLGPQGWQRQPHAFRAQCADAYPEAARLRLGPDAVDQMAFGINIQVEFPDIGVFGIDAWPDILRSGGSGPPLPPDDEDATPDPSQTQEVPISQPKLPEPEPTPPRPDEPVASAVAALAPVAPGTKGKGGPLPRRHSGGWKASAIVLLILSIGLGAAAVYGVTAAGTAEAARIDALQEVTRLETEVERLMQRPNMSSVAYEIARGPERAISPVRGIRLDPGMSRDQLFRYAEDALGSEPEPQIEETKFWLRAAAEQRHPEALVALGFLELFEYSRSDRSSDDQLQRGVTLISIGGALMYDMYREGDSPTLILTGLFQDPACMLADWLINLEPATEPVTRTWWEPYECS